MTYIELDRAIDDYMRSLKMLETALLERVIDVCTDDIGQKSVHDLFSLDVKYILTLRLEIMRLEKEITKL